MKRWKTGFQAILALAIFAGVARADVPSTVLIQGTLLGSDAAPLLGTRAWKVQYYDAQTGGHALGSPVQGELAVERTGRWSVSVMPPAAVLTSTGEVWYELGIDSAQSPDGQVNPQDIFPGRVRVESVMFAQRAANAERLGGEAASNFVTNSAMASALIQYVTEMTMDSRLAQKAEVGHTHYFADIQGTITDAQVPDNITILNAGHANYSDHALLADDADFALLANLAQHADTATTASVALRALLADRATTATVALTLAEPGASIYATNAALNSGLAGKADLVHDHDARYYTKSQIDTSLTGKSDTSHTHNLQDLGGAVTDAQVPNNITIDHAASADEAIHAASADVATTAAVALQLATSLASGFVTTGTLADELALYTNTADLTAALGGKADVSHTHNLQDLGGAVTDAQVPDDITITEHDTLASVTARGASTSATLTLGAVVLPASGIVYIGDPSTDGSWNISVVSGNLQFAARVSGSWVPATVVVAP